MIGVGFRVEKIHSLQIANGILSSLVSVYLFYAFIFFIMNSFYFSISPHTISMQSLWSSVLVLVPPTDQTAMHYIMFQQLWQTYGVEWAWKTMPVQQSSM